MSVNMVSMRMGLAPRIKAGISRVASQIGRRVRPAILMGAAAVAPATLIACGGTGETEADPVIDILKDGGSPTHDAGGVSLDGNLFSGVEISSGATGFDLFQDISTITLTSGWISGKGLQDENLVIALGTNSSWLGTIIPNDACLPDLIDTKQLSEEDIAAMEEYNEQHPDDPIFIGCPDEVYYTWERCPTDLGNRAHLYLESVAIEAYRYNGEENVKIDEIPINPFTIEADLYQYDPATGDTTNLTITPLGIICGVYDLKAGQKPNFVAPNYVSIPKAYYSNGSLYMKVQIKLLLDARHISQVLNDSEGHSNWRTFLEGWVQIR